jgi:protein-L-isoaspartate(D-aspartate) O-methyltransferase
MTDFAAARRNMVDGQVRTANVTDQRVISAMLEVPRERFLPAASAALAYLDLDAPLGNGRRLLRPMMLAKLIQAAEIEPTDRVLDVGCASGYGAAVLGRIAGEVIAVEEDAGLAKTATDSLVSQPNVTIKAGPLASGWPQGAAYDAIVLEGATEVVPHALCEQLKTGGRLVCILGVGPGAKAMVYTRSSGDVAGRPVFDAAGSLLPGFAKTPVFAF